MLAIFRLNVWKITKVNAALRYVVLKTKNWRRNFKDTCKQCLGSRNRAVIICFATDQLWKLSPISKYRTLLKQASVSLRLYHECKRWVQLFRVSINWRVIAIFSAYTDAETRQGNYLARAFLQLCGKSCRQQFCFSSEISFIFLQSEILISIQFCDSKNSKSLVSCNSSNSSPWWRIIT